MPRVSPHKHSPGTARRTSGRHGPVSATGRSAKRNSGRLQTLRKSRMTGDLPNFNDWASPVVCGSSLYFFGGCHPGDAHPSCDFYRWNIESLEWTELTVSCLKL